MSTKKTVTQKPGFTPAPAVAQRPPSSQPPVNNLFGKENYIWIIAGLVAIGLGLILMAGGKSEDPNVFTNNEVYSFRRITLAPILILLGLGLEVYAIFRKPKA